MNKIQEYLEKLAPNQAEFVGTTSGGLNVQGSLEGHDLGNMYQTFLNKLPKDKRNGPNIKALFKAWMQKTFPDVWKKIEEAGGFDALLGDKEPADIIISGTDNKKAIQINPDK